MTLGEDLSKKQVLARWWSMRRTTERSFKSCASEEAHSPETPFPGDRIALCQGHVGAARRYRLYRPSSQEEISLDV